MTVVSFGEWMPDAPALALDGLTVARNCMASVAQHYEPWPTLVPITEALTDPVLGAAAGKDADALSYSFAGTGEKLYELGSDGTWSDVTNAGGDYTDTDGERWQFASFGSYLIATKLGDPIQYVELGSAQPFDDLGSNAPEARYIGVVRDFVVTGYTNDIVDGVRPLRIWWSPIGDPAGDWTPDAATQADFQDLPSGDAVTGIVGGETGLVLCERDIYRLTYVGSPLVFQIDSIAPGRGCIAPGSVATDGRLTIFLAEDGFYGTDGATVEPIGAGKIDQWFFNDADPDAYGSMSAIMDPTRQVYMLAYVSANSPDQKPDTLLLYNWLSRRWTYVRTASQVLCVMLQPAVSIDDLDTLFPGGLDTITLSLDSRVFVGGQRYRGAIDPDGKLAVFGGPPLTATFETGEAALGEIGARAMIRAVRPLCDGERTIAIGTRNDQSDTVTWGGARTPGRAGFAGFRADARFHRARLVVSGNWTKVQGLDVDHVPTGVF